VVRTSPTERRELFEATIGGVGLTGVVLRVCFGLERVPSVAFRWRARRIPDLDAFLAALEHCAIEPAYVVGWVDGTARGASLGRGILETAEFTSAAGRVQLPPHRATARGLAFPEPPFVRQALAAWNSLRLLGTPAQGTTRTLDVARVLFPLEANPIYGRLRLRELHAVFPESDAGAGLRRVLTAVSESPATPLLVALKRFGRAGVGHLSFAIPGHSLVIDLPADRQTDSLLPRLQDLVLEHGGRIYLAKDSTLSATQFARMYPRLGEFQRVLADVDPHGVFRSDLARRLRIRELAG
jgi:decaprenylphospho-beta-D-ribofuranose 2-oxidase